MAKMNAETKTKIKQAARHPVVWWRGSGLPEENIRPWEGGIQFFAEALKGFMKGYVSLKDHLFIGMGPGKVPPMWKSYSNIAITGWDIVNNPAVGSFMDRRRYSENAHRWIMRFNATLSPLFILVQCFNFGISPFQRIMLWTLVTMFHNVMSTANLVSETKIWAGITPHDKQRSFLQLCKVIGNQLSDVFNAIPMMLMGMKELLGLSDYQIMIYGAILFAPFTVFSRWLPSFAKQRVDFTVQVQGENQTEEQTERPPTLREAFAVVKHNRWFMVTTAANLIRMLFPITDYMYQYRFLFPKMTLGGRLYDGLIIWGIKNVTFGLPCLLLQPFANKVVGKFKNKVQFLRFQELFTALAHIGMYLAGYKSWPRIFLLFTIEMFRGIIDNWAPVPRETIKYEMLDYVEWKTGQRGEGVTMSLDRMINGVHGGTNKSLRENIHDFINKAVLQWTGFMGFDYATEEQPDRFLDTMWPLTHWGKIAGGVVGFIALLFFKYPHDPKEVEADLIERRALAEKLKEEIM